MQVIGSSTLYLTFLMSLKAPVDDQDDEYVVVDEDADFDESQSSGESDGSDGSQSSRTAMGIRREAKMLDDMSKYLIPYIGSGVENMVLAHSKGLTNAVVSGRFACLNSNGD